VSTEKIFGAVDKFGSPLALITLGQGPIAGFCTLAGAVFAPLGSEQVKMTRLWCRSDAIRFRIN
jgi:hypothetical protein